MLFSLPAWCATGWATACPVAGCAPGEHCSGEPAGTAATFKVNVNLVDVFFTVKDKDGRLVPHLTGDDCTVSEDQAPQKLKSFAAETSLPLTLGILLDTSGSQYRVLAKEQEAGDRFLEQVLKAKDVAFLITFDVNVDLLQDITGDVQSLTRGMNKAEINTAGGNGAGGAPGAGGGTIPTIGRPKGTLLYDAVYLAASQVMNQETGRKAMILLTDGQDEGSKTKDWRGDCRGAKIQRAGLRDSDCGPELLCRCGIRGPGLQRQLSYEENDRGDGRAADRSGQQQQKAGGGISAD